jgi:hypothetical protein
MRPSQGGARLGFNELQDFFGVFLRLVPAEDHLPGWARTKKSN